MFIKITIITPEGVEEPTLLNLERVESVRIVKKDGIDTTQIAYISRDTDGCNWCDYAKESVALIAEKLERIGKYRAEAKQ